MALITDFDGAPLLKDPIPMSSLKTVDLGKFAKRKVKGKKQATLTQMLPPKSGSAPRNKKAHPKPSATISRGVRGTQAMSKGEIAAQKIAKQMEA